MNPTDHWGTQRSREPLMPSVRVSLLGPKVEGDVCREDPQELMENIQHRQCYAKLTNLDPSARCSRRWFSLCGLVVGSSPLCGCRGVSFLGSEELLPCRLTWPGFHPVLSSVCVFVHKRVGGHPLHQPPPSLELRGFPRVALKGSPEEQVWLAVRAPWLGRGTAHR